MSDQKTRLAPMLHRKSYGNGNGQPSCNALAGEMLQLPAACDTAMSYRVSLETARAAALLLSGNSVVITDRAGTVLWVNPAFTRVTGYSADEAIGRTPRLWSSGNHPQQFYKNLWDTILAGQPWHGTIVNRRKDGALYSEEMTIIPILSHDGQILNFASIKQDVTEHEQDTEKLRHSEHRCRILFENSLAGVFRAVAGGKLLDCNPAFAALLGYSSREELLQHSTADILYDPAEERAMLGRLAKHETLGNFEIRLKRKDGTPVWVLQNVALAAAENGQPPILEGTALDISRRRHAEQELREREDKLRLILESTAEAICGIDDQNRCTFSNSAAVRLLGYKNAEELLGRNMHNLIHHTRLDGTPVAANDCLISQAVASGQGAHSDSEVFWKADGTSFPVEYWCYPQWKEGRVVGGVVAFVDITERKQAAEQIQYLAYYDAVTGLPNRTLLEDRLSKALASARRRKEKIAVIFLDLDQFKIINDSLGHTAGDLLLKEVASRLKTWLREQDTVARLGGDEFVLVLNAVKEIGDAAVAAKRILDTMAAPFSLQGRSLSISCSLGISIFPDHGDDPAAMIQNADTAMYCAKDNGRNTFQFFTSEMNAQVLERLNLETSLRFALERNELFLMYQPQMDISTGAITGAEALLRWQHPELGLVPPDKFIRIAENSGLIVPIGEWVMRTACLQARQWQDQGLPAIPVAVNVSAVQFRQEGFLNLVKKVLHDTGLPPQYLELELTESLIMSNADVILSALRELKDIGVKLSIDDFGTGYSSLSYLRHFPVYKLKVDRSFVRDVTANADGAAITSTIISMAKSLNLKVIAEGVESEEQVSFLSRHRCDEIQGYYFSKPLREEDFAARLQKGRR
jgi:diguanylate cyclase (GGDEF)-like protein/PAS domain S-box-containing protein